MKTIKALQLIKKEKKRSKWKHAIYLILALGMLIYALPLISFDPGAGWMSLFGAVWAAFAFMVVGAHLHFLLGVNEEKQRALEAVRRAKLRDWQSKLLKKDWQVESKQG
ncbi:hypothetical protein EIM92_19640 [Paenibacillus lentus]|uniref:2TM domain-containing protein n=2 Tax=Paenibacillus lentus TaxID=1338368 RepID=A0A3Q8SEV0_9BACL|nr:hypothetical protein EIM92_19640 [Paenibacillus lentus]